MKKKAVIFDMDGLMIDSERVTFECFRKILAETDRSMPADLYKKILGRPYVDYSKILEDYYGSGFDVESVVGRVHGMMASRFEEDGVPVKQGLTGLLVYLRKHNFKTVVASSSSRVRVEEILALSGLSELFDGLICGDEAANGKPDPEIFLKACDLAGCEPGEAYVLEDSEMGIEAACAAGIDCIVVPDMKYPEDAFAEKARWIVNDLQEAMGIIEMETRNEQI